MASLLASSQSSPASQRLQKNTAISHSPCGSGLARDGVAAVFKAELAGKPAPTEKHRNLPPPPCGSGLARDGSAAVFKAKLAGKPAPTEKTPQSPTPPVGAGLPAMAAPLSSRQSSLASQLLQKSIDICPSPCGSGLARDGSAAVFKAELAGKPAPTEKHRNLPLPLWEWACPRWQRRCLQGRARRQASSYRKASARDGSAAVFKAELAGKPAPTEKHLPAMAAPLSSRQSSLASQLLQKNTAISHSPCGSGLARHIGDEPLTLCVNCSRSR